MDVGNAIRQRRSIRQYTNEMPKKEDVKKILEAAIWAPSGLNNQPWKFKVIEDKPQKDGLAEFTKYSKIVKNAPLVICVFLDNSATYNRDKDVMAVGAAIENMLLTACELGLAACWLGEILNKASQVQDYLKTDSDYELMAVVTLGFSDEEVTKGCRRAFKSFTL